MWLRSVLALVLLAGCVDPEPAATAEPPSAGAPLAAVTLGEPLAIDGGEVVERNASNATLVWRGATTGEAVETTLRLPGDADLHLRAALARSDAGRLRLTLLDSDGETVCLVSEGIGGDPVFEVERATTGEMGCTIADAPSTPRERAWTLRVDPSFRGTPSGGSFEVTIGVAAHKPVGAARLADIVPFEAKAADGVALRGHVYLPTGPGPFDTILYYSPYWGAPSPASDAYARTIDGEEVLAPMQGMDAILQAGYAVALVNIRGTGASDGCYQYMNQPKSGPDANAVIDALAAQPWSSGDVGMYGISYLGATQFAAVAFGPSPHLKAAVPVSGEWFEWNMIGNSYGAMSAGATIHAGHRNRQQGLGVTLPPYGDPGVSTLHPEHWCETTNEPEVAFYQFAVDGDNTGWFEARDLGDELAGKSVPFFATFGMRNEGHILQSNDLWDKMPTPRRLMLGPWDHAFPTGDTPWFTRAHAIPWFDHFMRGGAEVPTDRVDYQDDTGAWRVASSWPPAGERVVLRMSAGALVADPGAATASEVRLANNDANDLFRAGCVLPDRAVFASPPLTEDVVIAGNLLVDLPLASTAPNGNVGAALWAVAGDPCDPDADDRWLQEAVSDLRHRGHLELGSDFPLTGTDDMHMTSPSLAKRVYAGERLALVVGAGVVGYVPKPFQPVLTLQTGPDVPADLTLTVVDGHLRFDDA